MARMLATSANDAAHALITAKSIQRSFKYHPMKDSNDEGTTFSPDDGGGEGVIDEIWLPIAEASMKGIFNRLIVCRCT